MNVRNCICLHLLIFDSTPDLTKIRGYEIRGAFYIQKLKLSTDEPVVFKPGIRQDETERVAWLITNIENPRECGYFLSRFEVYLL